MIDSSASSKEEVNAMYAKAISLGAATDGDPDGNKLAFYIFG